LSNEKENNPGANPNPEERGIEPRHRHYPEPYGYYPEEDEIDLVELAKTVWNGRRYIYYCVGVFVLLGLFVALGSGEEYESEVKLIPEMRQSPSMGGLGGLARQFGVGGGGSAQPTDAGIPPDLYPDVTRSVVLMQRLMDYEVDLPNSDQRVTLFEYFTEHNDPSAVSIAKKYTVNLPFTILGGVTGLFRSEEEETDTPSPTGFDREIADDEKIHRIIQMSSEEWEIIRNLRERVSTNIGRETGMVTVSVRMPNGEIAADVADQVVEFLSEYITNYRTEKARADVDFIEQRYREAQNRFEEAQEALARFRDENRGELTSLAATREQRLQSEYDLTFNLYNTMAERLEESRIKLQEDTPVVSVIEPAAVPDQRSEPKRGMIMIISVLLGGIIGVGVVFGKQFLENFDTSGFE